MPTLHISEEQAERLRDAQIDIQGRMVGKYGRVRPQDAVEYLLDHYEEEREDDDDLSQKEREAAADRIVDLESTGEMAVEGREAVPDGATAAVDTASTESGSSTTASGSGGDASVDAGVDDGDETASDSEPTDSEAGGGDDDSAGDGGNGAADAAAAMLSNTMNLLNEHADKWGEDETGEDRYAVALPDGTTERARTKDDVRALLFKHY